MQIGTSLFFDRSTAQLGKLAEINQNLQTQIATGKRLAAPSDDAVAYRRLQSIAVSSANDAAWGKNIDLARSVLNQADTTLDSVTSQLQRAQELAIQASNGTLSAGNRQVIASQLRNIVDDLVATANAKDVRGGPLFGSASGDSAVTRDAAGTVSFTGTGDPAAIPIGDDASVQPSDSAERIFGGIAGPSGTTDVFALISSFASALESGNLASASGVLDGLKAGLDQVATARSSIGARGARLDLETTRLGDANVARETDRAAIEDTDLTSAISELQKTTTILQATQASLARLSSLSLFDYLR